MKNNQKNTIPKFKSEDEEREFWATHDFTDFQDQFESVELDLSNLKPSTKTISLRLPEFLLADIKRLANKKDVPYQSLMKIFLAQSVEREFKFKQE